MSSGTSSSHRYFETFNRSPFEISHCAAVETGGVLVIQSGHGSNHDAKDADDPEREIWEEHWREHLGRPLTIYGSGWTWSVADHQPPVPSPGGTESVDFLAASLDDDGVRACFDPVDL
jgi:hypothetical protein